MGTPLLDQWQTEARPTQCPDGVNETHPKSQGAAQYRGRQGGGARLPPTEARTFTPTFCFTSDLARRLVPPRTGSPDTDFPPHWGSYLPSPVASTSSENFIPGYQDMLPRVVGHPSGQQSY